ncbi:MAG: ATPase [Deltaproteobacteria bacterium]|nr:ATPase [Deltaproteobacteria bacterium]
MAARIEILEVELAEARRELEKARNYMLHTEKMVSLGTLLAGMAHEINTPVGAIASMHNTSRRAFEKLQRLILAAEPVDTKVQRLVAMIDELNKVIVSGIDRVVDIVTRLRRFARPDEQRLALSDIHEGLEDALTIAHYKIKRHASIKRNFGTIPAVNCYAKELNQVFLNLLINAGQSIAEKDGEERGLITLNTFIRDDVLHVEFSDTGCGIDPESLERIFDPGYTTKPEGVGTGLGLAICKRIMKMHHGELRVSSELGKGTTFSVILPLDLSDAVDQACVLEGGASEASPPEGSPSEK